MIKELIYKLVERQDLTQKDIIAVISEIANNLATPAQIGSFLTALRMKGEKPKEIAYFAKAMRDVCIKLDLKSEDIVDTAGTGGDRIKTFNVSTASALVLAAAGVKVAKHGNRAVSGKSGSADVLEEFGMNIYLDPNAALKCLNSTNFCFLFAPMYHPATKSVAIIRKEIGIRTIFNILGPLTNPANIKRQVLGVAFPSDIPRISEALSFLNVKRAIVIHGLDGLDEFSISSSNLISFINESGVEITTIDIEKLGYKKYDVSELYCNNSFESAKIIFDVFSGREKLDSAKSMFIIFNAALGFLVSERVNTLQEGVELARETIKSGKPLDLIYKVVKESNGNLDKLKNFDEK